MKLKSFILGLFVLALAATAHAQHTPKIAKRQYVQHQRIADGKKSGELSRKETALLRSQQRQVRASTRLAKADGKVSRNERKRIRKQQKQANRSIYRLKHNKVSRNR